MRRQLKTQHTLDQPIPRQARFRLRRGFTLVELLVVMAIIAMFMIALFPAVQSMRTSARRAQCRNQLLQVVMAAQNFEMAHEHFPSGVVDPAPGPIQSVAQGHHHGWIIPLLPYLDENNVYRRVNRNVSVYDAENDPVRSYALSNLTCPADRSDRKHAESSYAACHHGVEAPIDSNNQGVFYLNSETMIDDVKDGLAQTIFFGEKRIENADLGWMSGTRSTIRNTGSPVNLLRGPGQLMRVSDDPENGEEGVAEMLDGQAEASAKDRTEGDSGSTDESDNGDSDDSQAAVAQNNTIVQQGPLYVGGFSSAHPAGAHVAFGDGRIQFMTPQVNRNVLQFLGNRDDGALLSPEEYRE